MKSETPREVAERFIGSGDNIEERRKRCAEAIEAALNAERERCAKIADMVADSAMSNPSRRRAALTIAAAIRGSKQ